eukprot:SAG11_NODE_182_length_13233_cov_59.525238_12_plen_69_part_00
MKEAKQDLEDDADESNGIQASTTVIAASRKINVPCRRHSNGLRGYRVWRRRQCIAIVILARPLPSVSY